MARIIYGVSGEGSGHSSRALEMGRHLISQGHEIRLVSYDRGYRNLSPYFDVLEIEGLHIVSENNRVRPLKTIWNNLRRARPAWRRLGQLRTLFDNFAPDCVITDFEPSTAWLAHLRRIPLISLDNQHRMRYMKYSSPPQLWFSRLLATTLIRLMIPAPRYALATTFFYGELSNSRTFLFPPILRQEVLDCQPSTGNHHLVYVNGPFTRLLPLLQQFPDKQFIVYGSDRQGESANLQFRAFSVEGFLRDLESCQSVIATAGFTLTSEALYLGKPYLALPMQGQFEQELNALCLSQLGFGHHANGATVQDLTRFFQALPVLGEKVREYARENHITNPQEANQGIRNKLDELLSVIEQEK